MFVHEFGHFLAAKKLGVRVETFSVGMGPKLLRHQYGETEYCLSAIPLGGYVKLKGENPYEETSGAPDELMAKPIWARFIIFFSGPGMNIVLAAVLVSAVYFIGIQMPKYLEEPPVIGWIESESPAAQSDLQVGDAILNIGGQSVATWEQALLLIASHGKKTIDLQVERDGRTHTVTVDPEMVREIGASYIGVQPEMKPVVGGLQPGFPAEEAGLQPGDEIVAIDGAPVVHWIQMANIVHAHPDEELALTIQRDSQTLNKTITPRLQGDYGYLGITSQQQTVLKKYGIVESISRGVKRCWELTEMTFGLLRRLVTRQASAKSIGGPIMIAQMSGQIVREGLSEILNFMGLISLSLAIFNLLPIPILDGGHIFLLLVEALNRKPLSLKKRELAQKIGLLILVPIFLYVFYNDIARILGW